MRKIILTFVLLLSSLAANAYDWGMPLMFNSPTVGSYTTITALDVDGLSCTVVYYVDIDGHPRSKCAKFGTGLSMVDGVMTLSIAAGPAGKSAFQIAQDNGYPDTMTAWLASLKVKGDTGNTGPQGVPGSPAANDWPSMTNKPTTVAALGVGDAVSTSALTSVLTGYTTGVQLATKYTIPACPTSQYLRGDGTCMTFPTIPAAQVAADWNATSGVAKILNQPIINRARITTAMDGTYTWTYPIACGAGQIPVVQMTPEGSASVTYNTVITAAPTNTAVSIKITQVTDVVVLTIHVLGVAPASATVVHLTAICP